MSDDSVVLSIILPATLKEYDFLVSKSATIATLTSLVGRALEILEPDFVSCDGHQALMLKRSGEIQQAQVTIGEMGLVNGEQLVFI